MKLQTILLLILLPLTGAFSQSVKLPPDLSQREIVFRSVNVIPMDRERVIENQTVIVKDGRIKAMGDANTIKIAKGAFIIDGKGKFLMPGLAELHAHVPTSDKLQPMEEVAALFAVKGVTTIRGMLGHPKHIELRELLKSGKILGPRLYTSGPSFNGQSITSARAADELVRAQKKQGYDFLKLHPGLSLENFNAMVKTAREVNIPFAGHVSFDVGVWRAIEAEYATIDHLDGFVDGLIPGRENMKEDELGLFAMYVAKRADENKIPELMKALRDHHVWVVPTQALAERWLTPERDAISFRNDPEMKYMDSKTLDNWVNAKKEYMADPRYDSSSVSAYIQLRRKLIYECNKNGVGLLLGSDAPQVFNVPGFSTHQELQLLTRAGLTPFEALKTGTSNAGIFYGLPEEMGVIKPGAFSDLVLLNANPLDDISNTQHIEGVMAGKKWLSKSFINQTLLSLEKK